MINNIYWYQSNANNVDIEIYRSTSPLDVNDLPEPIELIDLHVNYTYINDSAWVTAIDEIEPNIKYYYIIEVKEPGKETEYSDMFTFGENSPLLPIIVKINPDVEFRLKASNSYNHDGDDPPPNIALKIDYGDGLGEQVFENESYFLFYNEGSESQTITITLVTPVELLSIHASELVEWGGGYHKVELMSYDEFILPSHLSPYLTTLEYMCAGIEIINGDITGWDTSNVSNMRSLFNDRGQFNQDISGWDVSNVIIMTGMFRYCNDFNQDISGWDVSNVVDMTYMFYNCSQFNQDLSQWDVSNVVDMKEMFRGCSQFNQDLSQWDVGNVMVFEGMFEYASSFSQDLSLWDTRNTFGDPYSFSDDAGYIVEPLWGYYLPNRTSKSIVISHNVYVDEDNTVENNTLYMSFAGTTASIDFNDGLGVQRFVDEVTYVYPTLEKEYLIIVELDDDIESLKLDVGNLIAWGSGYTGIQFLSNINQLESVPRALSPSITSLHRAFANNDSIPDRVRDWDMEHVTDISYMFENYTGTYINQGSWNFENVTNMDGVFKGCTNLSVNLRDWCVTNFEEEPFEFKPENSPDIQSPIWGSCGGLWEDKWSDKLVLRYSPLGRWDREFRVYFEGTSAMIDLGRGQGFVRVNNKLELAIGQWDEPLYVTIIPDGPFETLRTNANKVLGWGSGYSKVELSAEVYKLPPTLSPDITNLTMTLPEDFDADITGWDTSNVTDMSGMFSRSPTFNQDISGWDVSNVTDMFSMFNGCKDFNQDLSGWNVSNVTNMRYMFHGCRQFNQDLSQWDVGNVTSMERMFYWCSQFNQDLSGWDVGNVTNMSFMFCLSSEFNGDISGWDVSNVTDMRDMFYGCVLFNQDLSGWDVGNVTDMASMFSNCSLFNSDLSGWNVGNVTDMSSMFYVCSTFNSDISGWDVSNVTDMTNILNHCTNFNQDLSGWDVSNVTVRSNFDAYTDAWTLPKPNWAS